ncbi:MAG: 5-methyltetrahydrofolate--homocysteine methyltransferase [Chloroflexota bacterium]|jgi:5-methyltetrahydrofolate--homocysteine methyltransferase|nr:5-methyltetrahydrofolate--homocysteine methyltransferase [Chloroflexota bacterium]
MQLDLGAVNPPDGLPTGDRSRAFEDALRERILVLDGAQGTYLQGCDLTPEDFGGPEFEGCNEYLVVNRPDIVSRMHRDYYKAGSDVVGTDTFGSTPLVLGEYGISEQAEELSAAAARLARTVAAEFTDRPRWVSGSLGPTTKAISVTGGISFEELAEHYRVQARGLLTGGVDLLLLETIQDTRNAKAGILGIWAAMADVETRVPLLISGTIEPMGSMLAGQGIDAFYTSVEHAGALSVGLNCATGPEFMTDHVRTLSGMARTFVSCYPNAGLPDEMGQYSETPEMMTETLGRFMENGWINIVGGCCGTTPEYIRQIADAAHAHSPRQVPSGRLVTHVSGIDYVEVEEDSRPLIIGERTNVIGSRKFRRLVESGEWEEAAEVARAQVKAGAQLVDVCMSNPDRDEIADIEEFLMVATRIVKAPLVIDATDTRVYETALPYSQGKAILNSINLEDGEKRFESVIPVARRFGAALVVGCIDERGQAISTEEKLKVGERSHQLLTEKYGVQPEDIIWDPLVFPCATGDENYRGSAPHTINAITQLKERFPGTRTALGISNVSFGLPPAGREVLNSVYLYHCTKAGLDFAIVSSEKLVRYGTIPEDEKKLCDDLLFRGSDDDIAAFTAHFRERKPQQGVQVDLLPIDERLASYIIQGTKEGLIPDLEAKRAEGVAPLEIINGPLMAGMDEVGRLFGNNELIVAEVLQSAEVMKAGVAHLEQFMEKTAGSSKGKILLATVKGDVHDIGKNLVEIILGNNGFEIINLGIKVAPETLVAAAREHKPDYIGLSGLLVKSAQQMVVTAEDLQAAGIDVPLLVGGAALTPNFTYRRILPTYQTVVVYAKDAMEGLDIANRLRTPEGRAQVEEQVKARVAKLGEVAEKPARPVVTAGTDRSGSVQVSPVREAPDLERHELALRPSEVWPYLNEQTLFGSHLGLTGNVRRLAEAGDEKYLKVKAMVDDAKRRAEGGWVRARGVYQYFLANSDGNDVVLYAPNGQETARFTFPRQPTGDQLCLADYVAPVGGDPDSIALFVTSAGAGIRKLSQELKERGEYVLSQAIQALAIETAEAFAEKLHHDIRRMWGIEDATSLTMADIQKARYQGIRVSFGYPACPDLSDQETLFRLLHPQSVGVDLTDGFMMDPEASVSAVVFHHPQARYFGVGVTEDQLEAVPTA